MDIKRKKLPIMMALILTAQSVCFMQTTAANSFPILSKTEFSETTRNMHLENKVEVFPSPIYLTHPETGELIPTLGGERGEYPLYQAFVSESSPMENFSAEQKLNVGIDDSKQNVSLLKFGNTLPDLEGGLIYHAALHMYEIDNYDRSGYMNSPYIDRTYSIHKVLTDWGGDSVTWETRPQISDAYAVETEKIKQDGGFYRWDVTKMVKEWYQFPNADYGLAVKGKEEVPESLRSFYTSKGYSNKSYNQNELDYAPRLIIDYSPRPKFSEGIGNGMFENSGETYVDLKWNSQTGVKGYKLSIFNGKEYETIDIGLTTSWTSRGKNFWPSAEEVKNGAYHLKLDGSGTDLSDNPGLLYKNAGDTEKDPKSYYFKLTAYNELGESAPSDELSVRVPNSTALDIVSNVVVTEASPDGVKVKWDSQQDAIKYRVKLSKSPEKFDLTFGALTTENEFFITPKFFSLSHGETIYISVEAVDKEGNYSGDTVPIPVVVKKKNEALSAAMFSSRLISVNSGSGMTIRVKNDGSEAWTLEKGYELKFVSNNALLAIDPLLPGEVIEPGYTKTFQIRFTGKQPVGEVPLKWRMHQLGSGFFGIDISQNVLFYDDIKPEVTIQSPNSSALLYKTVEVKGTAKDDRFKEYKLFYGSGSAPTSWNLISSGTDSVENDLLGNWDISELASGTYTLKLEAIDEGNNESLEMREVKVNLPLGQINVRKVTDQSDSVSGSAYQNGLNASISIQKGDQVLGSGNIDMVGMFSIPIGKQPVGTVLTLHLKNEFGVTVKEMPITVMDGTPPAPKVNMVADHSIQVSGTAEKGSSITVLNGTAVIGSVDKTNLDGSFAVNIAKQAAGAKLQVVAKDADGNASVPTIVTVIDKTAPPIPVVNTIGDNSTSVTGKTEKGATVTVKSGSAINVSVTAGVGGAFTVSIPKQKAGTVISVSAKDAIGNISPVLNKAVVDKTPPPTPAVNTVGDNSTSVKGTAEKGSTVSVKRGDVLLGAIKTNSDGSYVVSISKQKAGTILSVTAKDTAQNVSAISKKTVMDKTAPSIPTVKTVYSYSQTVSGKTEPYAIVTVKRGSSVIGTAKASSTGTYTVKIKPQSKRVVLSITAKDAAGNLSKAASMTVK
ncbi:Ig-like domain-containing protein [Planococcus sp. N028]|uniref:Ig-like domain-containing protein n=1 Tax=Planococcus shixiaomingii TaxID=3058393 RepID=A0ABT8MZH2_9BACL|nr:Ig-like domain-containing protein [Planococcus sp. N028]MDN7240740.1 Ig-like domain-containing protein [Planococcus sp. N028]